METNIRKLNFRKIESNENQDLNYIATKIKNSNRFNIKLDQAKEKINKEQQKSYFHMRAEAKRNKQNWKYKKV